MAQARKQDDIWQVSCALIPLLKERDLESQKLAALACQKWGTSEVVPELEALTKGTFPINEAATAIAVIKARARQK